jgi:hypothetical protein
MQATFVSRKCGKEFYRVIEPKKVWGSEMFRWIRGQTKRLFYMISRVAKGHQENYSA